MGKGDDVSASSPKVIDSISNLSGPLYPAAFILLYLYLIIYNLYQAFGVNDKDEDFIDCTCRDSDKRLYRGIFGAFTIFWIILVLGWQIFRLVDLCTLYVHLHVLL